MRTVRIVAERKLQATAVRATAAGAATDRGHRVLHVRALFDNRCHFADFHLQRFEADAFRSFDRAGQAAGVLGRQEALRDVHEQANGRDQCDGTEEHRETAAIHHPAQRAYVRPFRGLIQPLDRAPLAITRRMPFAFTQEARGQHRGERERHEAGHQNGHTDRDGELAEQAPHETGHEQQRNKDGHQRQRHRENREADFFRAVERRLHGLLSHLQVTHNVFEHHDGVVYDKTDREREGHQRQVIEAVAEHPHDRAGTDQRERQGQRGDDRGAQIPEEQEDHHHDQSDRENERELHIVDTLFDRDRPVVNRHDADAGR